jgi:hypothetical protein
MKACIDATTIHAVAPRRSGLVALESGAAKVDAEALHQFEDARVAVGVNELFEYGFRNEPGITAEKSGMEGYKPWLKGPPNIRG